MHITIRHSTAFCINPVSSPEKCTSVPSPHNNVFGSDQERAQPSTTRMLRYHTEEWATSDTLEIARSKHGVQGSSRHVESSATTCFLVSDCNSCLAVQRPWQCGAVMTHFVEAKEKTARHDHKGKSRGSVRRRSMPHRGWSYTNGRPPSVQVASQGEGPGHRKEAITSRYRAL